MVNIDIPESNITFEIWVKIEGEQVHEGRNIFQPYGLFNTNALIFDDCENQALGIDDERLDKSISLYPNPSSSILTINSEIPLTKVEIYSVLGQRVKQINQGFNSINIEVLSKGVYVIKITS